MVANPALAGEIRPSGMKRGAWGNVAYGGTVNPPRNRKGGTGNPPPTRRRAPVLSQPSDSKLSAKAGAWFPSIWPLPSLFITFVFCQRINLNDISVCRFGVKVTWNQEQSLRCLHLGVCQNLETFQPHQRVSQHKAPLFHGESFKDKALVVPGQVRNRRKFHSCSGLLFILTGCISRE